MTTYFNTIRDIERYLSDQFSNINLSDYNREYEHLVLVGALNLLYLMRDKHDWKWGEEIPYNISESLESVFDLISEFEK